MTTIQPDCQVDLFCLGSKGPSGVEDLKMGMDFEEFYDPKYLNREKGRKKSFLLFCVFSIEFSSL